MREEGDSFLRMIIMIICGCLVFLGLIVGHAFTENYYKPRLELLYKTYSCVVVQVDTGKEVIYEIREAQNDK